ncbi:MAG: hypothetical protein A3J83_03355 [Elusimicrobia bacterium RIFOXYA2_FULL_40_6]|nr:MAG: hypothetical protein A3J83_03355 [Elusimicrobia bacterium RIFOXYA2_FULL_40_6]
MTFTLKKLLHKHKWKLVHDGWGEKQKGARETVFALVKVFVCVECGEEHDQLVGPHCVEYPVKQPRQRILCNDSLSPS